MILVTRLAEREAFECDATNKFCPAITSLKSSKVDTHLKWKLVINVVTVSRELSSLFYCQETLWETFLVKLESLVTLFPIHPNEFYALLNTVCVHASLTFMHFNFLSSRALHIFLYDGWKQNKSIYFSCVNKFSCVFCCMLFSMLLPQLSWSFFQLTRLSIFDVFGLICLPFLRAFNVCIHKFSMLSKVLKHKPTPPPHTVCV